MTTYTDWLADRRAERIILVELVSVSNGTKYLADRTYVTGSGDTPSNTIYDGRLIGDVVIERRVSGPMGIRGGVANISDLIVANGDGECDSWPYWTWQTATIYYGDPSWILANLKSWGKRGTFAIETVEADDLQVRFLLRDKYEDLRTPVANTMEYRGANFANPRPLCYGAPKNVTPQVRDQDSTPVFVIHEDGDVQDEAVTRYINQKASTSPSITKYGVSFGLNGDPNGIVTCDPEGVVDSSIWQDTPSKALQHALTRSVSVLTGYARGGSSNTIQLDEDASAVDDAYNTETIQKGTPDDPANDNAESATISDYDGATRTVTISGTWTTTAAAGHGYSIGNQTVQKGPLTTSDLDTAAWDALDAALPYEIGEYINDRRTHVELLDAFLGPAGYHCWTAADKLTCGLLPDPTGGVVIPGLEEWTPGSGGVTLTSGQSDPFGGTDAYKLERIDSSDDRLGYEDIIGTLQDTDYEFEIWLKNDDADDSQVWFTELSPDIATFATVAVTWSGATPSVSVGTGTITDLAATEGDSDWWVVRGKVNTGDATQIKYNVFPGYTASANGEGIYVFRPRFRLAPALEMDDQDIQGGADGIEVVDVQHALWRLRVGYDRNFTPQTGGAAGSIDAARMAFIVDEYRWQIKEDFGILEDDPNARDVDIETAYTTGSDARAERGRLWALYGVQRATYSVKAYADPMGINLGSVVQITDDRHEMSSGKRLVMLGLVEDLSNARTEMELWG